MASNAGSGTTRLEPEYATVSLGTMSKEGCAVRPWWSSCGDHHKVVQRATEWPDMVEETTTAFCGVLATVLPVDDRVDRPVEGDGRAVGGLFVTLVDNITAERY